MDKSGRSKLRTAVSVLVMAGLTAWAVYYIWTHKGEFKAAWSWKPEILVLLSLLILIQYALVGFFNQVVLKAFGLVLTFKEWYGLGIITTLGNYLIPPRGGAGFRAAYLKKRHGFPLTHFLSTFVVFNVLNLTGAALAGLAGLALVPEIGADTGLVLTIFLAGAAGVGLLIMLMPIKAAWFDRPGMQVLARMIEGWTAIKSRPRLLFYMSLLVLLNGLVQGFIVFLGYRASNVHLAPAPAVLITSLLLLSSFIAITPGGLGIQEAVLIFSTRIIGIAPAQSLAVAVIIRAVILFWTFLLGPVFSWLLLKKPVPLGDGAES